MPVTDKILGLNGLPLKHIITKNKKSIELLNKTGSLIIYEPDIPENVYAENSNDLYRELYVGSYFLASGYGAKTRQEQENLSYISSTYNTTYNQLNNRIDQSFTYAYNLYTILDNTKVDRGNSNVIDLTNGTRILSDDYSKYNVSYNVMQFGNNGEDDIIYLYELYDKLHSLHILQKLEVSDVKYDVILDNGDIYNNYSYLPIYSNIKNIVITITGNTNDSNGISQIYIELFDNIHNDSKLINIIDNIGSTSKIGNTSNQNFELKLSKNFGLNNIFKIKNIGENKPIKHIQLNINSSSEDTLTLNKLLPELRDITEDFNLILYGAPFIYTLKSNIENIGNIYYENNSNIQLLTYYQQKILSKSNHYPECYQVDVPIIRNNNQELPKFISILSVNDPNFPLNVVRMVKAEYVDYKTNNIYDVSNFILCRSFESNNRSKYIQYILDVSNNSNDQYNSIINPPFISPVYNGTNIDYFTLNEGKLVLTFTSSSSNIDLLQLNNISEYWISYQDDQTIDEIPPFNVNTIS